MKNFSFIGGDPAILVVVFPVFALLLLGIASIFGIEDIRYRNISLPLWGFIIIMLIIYWSTDLYRNPIRISDYKDDLGLLVEEGLNLDFNMRDSGHDYEKDSYRISGVYEGSEALVFLGHGRLSGQWEKLVVKYMKGSFGNLSLGRVYGPDQDEIFIRLDKGITGNLSMETGYRDHRTPYNWTSNYIEEERLIDYNGLKFDQGFIKSNFIVYDSGRGELPDLMLKSINYIILFFVAIRNRIQGVVEEDKNSYREGDKKLRVIYKEKKEK